MLLLCWWYWFPTQIWRSLFPVYQSCLTGILWFLLIVLYMKSRSVNKEVSFHGIPNFGLVITVLITKSTARRNEKSLCQTLRLMLEIQFCSINHYSETGIQVESPENIDVLLRNAIVLIMFLHGTPHLLLKAFLKLKKLFISSHRNSVLFELLNPKICFFDLPQQKLRYRSIPVAKENSLGKINNVSVNT